MELLKHYRFDLVIMALTFAVLAVFMGPAVLVPLAILVVLEISFSFDNAVVNAKYLKQLSPGWQLAFLTIGVLIAVAGMRLIFPIVIVAMTASLSWGSVIDLALHQPHVYADKLEAAHPQIATFGGIFLLMIFLDFVFEEREIKWLKRPENALAKVGKLDMVSVLITLVSILVISMTYGHDHELSILAAGLVSLATYVGVNSLAAVFDDESDEEDSSTGATIAKTGLAAFGTFMYLEVQDASFSFDGVAGAFAITDQVVLIAAGLGIGALFVRSMTVHLVRTGKLDEFRYLEHGAHWAIGTLAICMLAGIGVAIPDWVTGLIGVVFIGFALYHSVRANKLDEVDASSTNVPHVVTTVPEAAEARV